MEVLFSVWSPLSQTHQKGHFSTLTWQYDSGARKHRNIYRFETAPTQDLPEWCLGGRPGGFAPGTTPRNSVGLLAPRTSAETRVLLPVTLTCSSHFSVEGGAVVFTRASKNESWGFSNWATLLISLWKVGLDHRTQNTTRGWDRCRQTGAGSPGSNYSSSQFPKASGGTTCQPGSLGWSEITLKIMCFDTEAQ